ncbi:MAG: phosphotransferase [Bacteroidales bacterium]|nr:phosphotransferase [Bacteroidales bacterium]
MKPVKISLGDYVLSGGGANGESYDHKTDPSVMLKLYFPGKISQPLDEMLMARKVYELGIPTPEPGEYVVTEDGRYGIRFKRILGKSSYSRAIGEHPEKMHQYASEFAQMCLDLHKIQLNPKEFDDVKDRYFRLLEENPFFSVKEKDRLGKFIADTPDENTALHGDLQYSNAIFTPEGRRYFIDLGDFCRGNHLFDIGMVYLCCYLSDAEFIQETYHMPKPVAMKFWDTFAPLYFGEGISLKDTEEMIRPYAGLKTLIIERDTKCPMPNFRAALKSVL